MSAQQRTASLTSRTSHVRVSHCADSTRRYPGETVVLYTKVEVFSPLSSFTLRVSLPHGLILGTYQAEEPVRRVGQDQRVDPRSVPAIPTTTWSMGDSPGVALNWQEDGELSPGDCYEYMVEATVAPTQQDLVIASQASLTARTARGGTVRDQETATLRVEAKGRALKYLPAIYRDDELMGRFLMLFESFWGPIGHQIDGLPYYFDPELAPSEFLPWLASWIDLVLDEQWTEECRRLLLKSAIPLFRRRGTRQGLAEYLRIYTGVEPEIVEYRAQNFRLGTRGQLGSGIALGLDNIPHTFSVRLRLPPIQPRWREGPGKGTAEGAVPSRDENEVERQELLRRRKIEGIIEAQKPAHTRYRLYLESHDDSDIPAPAGNQDT